MHYQAVRDLAPSLSACAKAADGLIEGVEMGGHPWFLAVQWHPEHLWEQDEAAALPWLGKAADSGNIFAKYALGTLLLCGETIPRNVDRALELLTECAEEGNQYAQYTLGKAYLLGQEIPQDQAEAVHWLKLSAEQGNQHAQYFLDRFYGSIFSSATSLLYHMGNIFQEQRQPPPGGMQMTVDSKLRQKIREKKIAMGHKPDDHEDQEQQM